MRVSCKINKLKELNDNSTLERIRKNHPLEEVDLEIGRSYTVYGIIFWDSSPWYYLCAEKDDEYPVPFACEFFEVIDDRLSSYWKLSVDNRCPERILPSLLFPEWAQDNPSFYERLLDDDPDTITTFMKYRQLMDAE